MNSVSVLVVEDEVIIAQTLQNMLLELGYIHSKRCKRFEEAKSLIASGEFGLVILDINLEGNFEGIELGQICDQLDVPYFFLTSYSDRNTFSQAKSFRPGSYVIKPFNKEEIMVAVELTLQDSSTELKEKMSYAQTYFELSNREAQLVKLVFEELTNQEMSQSMSVSPNTIKYHLKHIFSKMGVSSKREIIERVDQIWAQSQQ